jgi:nucleoporin SEH1
MRKHQNQIDYSRIVSLPTSHDKITQIKFAPKHQGLKLAAGTFDGYFLLYQPESLMNLSNWKLIFETNVCITGVSCLSWNNHAFDAPSIAIGCYDKDEDDGYKPPLLEQH